MNQKNDFDKQPAYWERMTKRRSLFAITPIIPHFFIVAIVLVIYYYITNHGLFPEWADYIYWGLKIIIGFEVLAAAARSFWGPILALLCGLGFIFSMQVYNLQIVTLADAWQLIIIAAIGFLVTIIVKL
jgi:hypothetical protein